jgi:hypothetical protein
MHSMLKFSGVFWMAGSPALLGGTALTPSLHPAYGAFVNCSPLQFPPQWPALRRRSLLVGVPLIGPQVGAHQNLCEQLSQRSPECWSLWGPDAARLQAAQFVAKTLADEVEWPNLILHPDDPFELLFWDHKSCGIDDLSVVGAMVTIGTHFNAAPSDEQFEKLAAGTVGDYVDFLLCRNSIPGSPHAPPS